MFDFGFAELFVIIAVAIFVVGPKDIPGVLKALGQGVRRLQYIRFSLSQQFEDFMKDNDLNEIRHLSVDPLKDVDEQTTDEMMPLEQEEKPKKRKKKDDA